jgi:predicted peptidase
MDAGVIDAGPFDAGVSSDRQTARPLGSTDAGNGFYEYLPPRYDDLQPRPLLVFWHGVGENGNGSSELSRVLLNGPPKLIAADQWPASRPFIVLSAQHSGTGCPSSAEIHAFITWAIANYRVDAKKVFLTGLSCGAIGSWDYLGNFTDSQVAAAMLVCGDPGDPNQSSSAWGRKGCGLGKVAIWALHGDADATVNIANAQATMNNLIGCPQPPRLDAIFTVIPGGTHDTWTATYDGTNGDIYAWLLAHAKP